MKLGRFERRILAAIIAVALVTLGGALWFGQGAVSEAYHVGVNERVLEQLERSIAIYRRHFVALRDDAERTADAIAFDRRAHVAIEAGDRRALSRFVDGALSRYPNVARVIVEDPERNVLAQAERRERLDETRRRLLTLERATAEGGRVLVTVSTDAEPFREHQQAGELVEVYARLVGGATYVSSFYLGIYIAFLLSVIVIALAVGIIVSRRVTRRVAVLAEATERVGRGDLSVEVPTDGRDEVAELTRAFNAMVRDIRESRDRIDYLQRIGAWQLVQELGNGGMGLVFLAERADDQFHQQVAIKLIRGLASPAAIAQLRRERQLLAGLEHPHIARLLDGGQTPQGQPYLVMEYVRGQPLTQACRECALALPQRLALLRDLALAVHHAHQHLIVHRDIKPGNVLLRDDGRPVLLDFGIAKLLGESPDAAATQPWFTPAYASPEQRRGEPISTASDVYGLGLLLYELLTDAPPPLERTTALPAPSQALHGHRRRVLRGDLDRIVARATAYVPADRYASAKALADDIDRHLAGQPILAAPDSRLYRLHKFARRHPFGLTATLLAALVLVHFAWRLADERDRAVQAEALAQEQTRSAEATTRFVTQLFSAADPTENLSGARLSPAELIDLGHARVREAADLPAAQRAQLLLTLGDIYSNLGLPQKAEAALHQALAEAPADAIRLRARALVLLGTPALVRQNHDSAIGYFSDAVALLRRQDAPLDMAHALSSLGLAQSRAGHYAEAVAALDESLRMQRQHPGMDPIRHYDTQLYLGETYQHMGDLPQALIWMQRAVDGMRRHYPPGHPELLTSQGFHANLLREMGERGQAEAIFRQMLEQRSASLAPDSNKIAAAYSSLAEICYEDGRILEAAGYYGAALGISETLFAPDDAALAVDYNNLASIHELTGNYDRARELFEKALEHAPAWESQSPLLLLQLRQNLGRLLMLAGQTEASRHRLERPIPDDAQPAIATQRWRQRLHLADWHRRQGDAATARRFIAEAENHVEDIGGRGSNRYAALLRVRALLAWAEGDAGAARADLLAAASILRDNGGERLPVSGEIALDLAELALAAGAADTARQHLEQGRDVLAPVLDPVAPQRTRIAQLQRQLAETTPRSPPSPPSSGDSGAG